MKALQNFFPNCTLEYLFTEDKEMTEHLRNDFVIPLTQVNKEVKIDYTHATT